MSTPDLATFGPDDLPDLTGKRIVVTGANSGIGFHAAHAFAEKGAQVILACRDLDKARAAAVKLPGTVEVEELDLASLASVRAFAERYDGPLDVLVNNAGVMYPPRYRTTEDGFELQLGTNHLGHFALTGLLLPRLLEAEQPRVVPVASIAHHAGDERVLEGNPREGYAAQRYYGNSKLANVLFGRELHRRAAAAASPLVVSSAHPGVSATNLVSSSDGLGAIPGVKQVSPIFTRLLFQSAKAGANPLLWAATYGEPGDYVGPTRFREARGRLGHAKLSRPARNDDLAARLWTMSEELTGVGYDL